MSYRIEIEKLSNQIKKFDAANTVQQNDIAKLFKKVDELELLVKIPLSVKVPESGEIEKKIRSKKLTLSKP